MVSLGSWMNEILIDWGVDPKLANMFDETIIAVLMIGVSIGLDYLCQAIFVGGMKHYTKRAPHQWNTLLMKRRVVHHLIHILPGVLVYFLLPLAFVRGKEILDFSQKICAVYINAADKEQQYLKNLHKPFHRTVLLLVPCIIYIQHHQQQAVDSKQHRHNDIDSTHLL